MQVPKLSIQDLFFFWLETGLDAPQYIASPLPLTVRPTLRFDN
jgi:hypothetical protein